MIEKINKSNINEAGEAYSTAWISSHRQIVSEEILNAHSPEERAEFLRKKMMGKGIEAYCYAYAEEVAGIIIIDTLENQIDSLYVIPEYWGKGIGKELISFAIHRLSIDDTIRLIVLNVNMRARRFYEKCGFHYCKTGEMLSEERRICELIYAYQEGV